MGNLTHSSDLRNWISRKAWSQDQVRFADSSGVLFASLSAAVLLSCPSIMINFALGAFITGIGLYLGFTWTRNLDISTHQSDGRNIFICFIASLTFCYGFYVIPSIWNGMFKGEYSFPGDEEGPSNTVNRPSPASHPRTDESVISGGSLEAALLAAAEAQEECARANRRLAEAYNSLHQRPAEPPSRQSPQEG